MERSYSSRSMSPARPKSPIGLASSPSFISNHLAAVADGPWKVRSSTSALSGRSYSPPPYQHAPTAVQLHQRASEITNDIVMTKEFGANDGAERGSPLRLDDAIIATTRARDESERVMAEVLAGVERSFQPHDDKRLVCRAYVAQLGRTAGRLRDATSRLEREAADSARAGAAERSGLQSRLHQLKVQSQGHAKVLQGEVERSEAERQAHGDHMHQQFERLRREREDESGRLGSDVSRLTCAADCC